MEINLKYIITETDLKKFVLYHVKHSKIHNLKRSIILMFTFLLSMFVFDLPPVTRIIYGIFMVLIVSGMYHFINVFSDKKKIFSNKQTFIGTYICTFSDDSICVGKQNKTALPNDVGEYKKKKYNWEEISYFLRDDDLFYIYIKKNRVILVKAGSKSYEDINLFLRNNTKSKKG